MKKITYLLSLSVIIITSQSYTQENVISENGNVGLGTGSATPTARLQVAGSTRIDSTLTVNDSVNMASSARIGEDLKVEGNLYLPNISTTDALGEEMILLSGADGVTTKAGIGIIKDIIYSRNCDITGGSVTSPSWANGPNKLFSECPQVLVGVGTASPTRQLDVVGSAKVSSHIWSNGSISIGADMNTFSKLNIVNTNRTAVIQGNTVGNTQPYQRLMYFEYDNPDTKIMEVKNTATSRSPFTLYADGQLEIDNGTAKIFHLGTNGMLSINNGTTETFRVEANGLTRARKIKVDADVWADYVFEDDYQLMPLSDVESFLKEHKHLPSIPSEKVMKEEGIDLAEMNVKMMEKIEELTLYLIEQNKELEKVKAELEILKQEKP